MDIQIISAHYRVLACFYWNEIDRDVCICEYIYIYMYTYGHVSSRGCPKSFNLGLFFWVSGTPLFDMKCKYIRLHLLYDKVGLEDKADKSRLKT